MLTVEQNERLTRVGPGTPLGDMLRRYWHPIAPVAVLDEDPVRKVKLLGEELVLYRDRSGTLGLVQPRCAHRLVHLQFGIPDEHGIRCPYHGWRYDETGQCTDTPLEAPNSHLKDHVNIGGYPVQELGGLVFAYMGPLPVPVLPPWDFLVWPNSIRQIGVTVIPCNWLQCHENSADPFHNTYLHGYFFQYALERKGLLDTRASNGEMHRTATSIRQPEGAERHVVFERDQYGFRKGVHYTKERGAPEDRMQWFPYNIFPYYSRSGHALRTQVNMRIPMDDTHTYHLSYLVYHAPGIEAPEQSVVPYFDVPMFDENGAPILDYVLSQDMAAWWSQGDITDRSRETLGGTDGAIIEFRKIIDEQIRAVEANTDPMNVFRDPAEVGECIEIEGGVGAAGRTTASRRAMRHDYRGQYHLGFYQDDVDRYGPALDIITDLMRRAAEADQTA